MLLRLGGALAAFVAMAAWALASAPSSAPDDPFHLSSIWCAHGLEPDRCVATGDDGTTRAVPAYVGGPAPCFARHPARSAACQQPVVERGPDLVEADGNWSRTYPPVFYWVMGWLVTSGFGLSVVLMRMLAALVIVGLQVWLLAVVPRRLRPAATVPLLVSSVPLGLSLLSSTNPSGWAIGSAAVLWVALHASYVTTSTARRAQLCLIAVGSAVVGAGARADACLFTVIAVLLAFVLNWGNLRARKLSTATGVICAGVAAYFFAYASQSAALAEGLKAERVLGSASGKSWFWLAVDNLGHLPTLWVGMFGGGALGKIGYLDTPFPSIVGSLTVVSVALVVLLSWRRPDDRRVLLAIGLAGLSLLVYPLYILGRSHLTVGQGVQPRYLLPLCVILLGLLLLGGPRLTRAQVWGLAAALSVGQTVALHVQLRRYLTGLDVSAFDLDANREWWWDMPVSPTAVWLVGSVAFAVTAWVVLARCTAEPDAREWDDGQRRLDEER